MRNFKIILLASLLLIFPNITSAEEATEAPQDKHEDFKRVIKERTQNMKRDAKVIKEAISSDFDGSTEELKTEYKKIEEQFDEFNKEISKQQKWLSQEKSKLSKKFKERQQDLEELIQSMVEE